MIPLIQLLYKTAKANLKSAKDQIGSVTGTKTGSETRPKNMRVQWMTGKAVPEQFPVGTILPWLSNLAEGSSLPTGWVECDGSKAGVPNLNGEQRFLRGGASDKVGQLEDSQLQDHVHMDKGHSHQDAGHTHVDVGHTPKFYEILIPGKIFF